MECRAPLAFVRVPMRDREPGVMDPDSAVARMADTVGVPVLEDPPRLVRVHPGPGGDVGNLADYLDHHCPGKERDGEA